jgi:hypothetical protein
MPLQTSYASAALTTAQAEYSTTPPAYPPTTTPPPYGANYQDGFGTITSTATAVFGHEDGDGWSWHISGPTRDQAAIIALGVICGLLTIGLAVLLFFHFYRGGKHLKRTEGELMISPGYQPIGRRKHHRDRKEYSRGLADDGTSYVAGLNGFYAPRKHRVHRRSQPVAHGENQRAGLWGNPGAQPAAFAQFPGPGRVYFPPGQGNDQAVPVVQVPMPAQTPQPQRGIEEVMSSAEQSEISSSSSQGRPPTHRQPSVRHYHSRTSSSHGGVSGRR